MARGRDERTREACDLIADEGRLYDDGAWGHLSQGDPAHGCPRGTHERPRTISRNISGTEAKPPPNASASNLHADYRKFAEARLNRQEEEDDRQGHRYQALQDTAMTLCSRLRGQPRRRQGRIPSKCDLEQDRNSNHRQGACTRVKRQRSQGGDKGNGHGAHVRSREREFGARGESNDRGTAPPRKPPARARRPPPDRRRRTPRSSGAVQGDRIQVSSNCATDACGAQSHLRGLHCGGTRDRLAERHALRELLAGQPSASSREFPDVRHHGRAADSRRSQAKQGKEQRRRSGRFIHHVRLPSLVQHGLKDIPATALAARLLSALCAGVEECASCLMSATVRWGPMS